LGSLRNFSVLAFAEHGLIISWGLGVYFRYFSVREVREEWRVWITIQLDYIYLS
jgi:hypothetical protein